MIKGAEGKRRKWEEENSRIVLRRRGWFGRLLKAPGMMWYCWKFANHPSCTTRTRLRFCWHNLCILLG